MTTVTFNFRTQNAESVRREIQRTLDATRQGQRAVQGQSQQAAQRSASAEQAATRAVLTEAAKRTQARRQEVAAARTTEQQITAAVLSEDRKRTSAGTASQRARIRSLSEYVNAARAAEQQVTRAQQQEQRRRSNAWGQRASSAVSGAIGVGSTLHGQIQDARQRAARIETSLNTTLLQTGASNSEIASLRDQAMSYGRANHFSHEQMAATVGEVQTRFSALADRTPEGRRRAMQQTLEDTRFARLIDPESPGGLVNLSGMLRQRGVGDRARENILRRATGIGFGGSVEVQEMISRGLPGVLRDIATRTSNAAPGQRDALTETAVTDFFANVQGAAAAGQSVTWSSNRLTALPVAFASADRQNRVGEALSRRRMTEEQRAEFNQTFRRNRSGRYEMMESVRNSPSALAAFFGHQFNNNPLALSAFMGVGGGGGRRQLLNAPDVRLLNSYFGTQVDANGNTVRGYEAVNTLARQTITPEQIAQFEELRRSEESTKLADEENARQAALSDNTNALVLLSKALAGFQANNPMLSTAGGTVAGALATGGAGLLAGKLGGTAIASTAASGLAAVAPWVATGLGSGAVGALVGDQINKRFIQGEYDYSGVHAENGGSMEGVRVRRVGSAAETDSIFNGETWRELGRFLASGFNGALKSPQAVVHAQSSQGTANGLTAEQRANRM